MSNNQSKNGLLGSDDRIKKSAGDDVRGLRSESEDSGRTLTDGTALSTEERRRAFRDEWTAEALPSIPPKDGWHFCWLSTTNSMDPIHRRIRMGYELVRAEEVPGYETYKMRSGQYEGYVGVNEMLLAKIPSDIYQDMMKWLHYDLPNQEGEKLRNRLEEMRASMGDRNAPLIEVEQGMYEDDLGPNGGTRRVPTFTD